MVKERLRLMMLEEHSFKDILGMRRNYIAKSCKLHFDASPLKIVRGSKQYMYDEFGNEYLDCINNISHVGHCHPHVVGAGQEQMGRLSSSQGFLTDQLSLYAKKLIETLPDRLCVCYFVNSGSEANDLAIQLARAYTNNEDIIAVEGAYHGNIGTAIDSSPKYFNKRGVVKKDYVHVTPCPDVYRGRHRDEATACDLYVKDFSDTIQHVKENSRKIAAFIHEPIMSVAGAIVPPSGYLKQVYRLTREAGGLVIADEVGVGMGRTGENFWSFQNVGLDVIPDIVTCGKPLGNGHPMAVVITTKEISNSLEEFSSGYGGNPVSCAIGLAVLDVIKNEKLLSSAKCVGRVLLEGFSNILPRHPMMGIVRGQGLVIGIEIVTDKSSRKPAKEAAELLAYKMKQQKIIIANNGPDKNVMTISPPLCFTVENARRVIRAFDECLTEIECGACPDQWESLNAGATPVTIKPIPPTTIPTAVVEGHHGGNGNGVEDSETPVRKRARYEDLD